MKVYKFYLLKKMKRQKNTNWGKIRIENTKIGVIK